MHIRKNDMVEVISGDDKGKRGRVLNVLRSQGKVVVEGVNRAYKHLKRSQKNPQGGRLSKEMAVDVSNVMLICPQTNRPTRVGVRFLPDGTKERYSKRSGAPMGVISVKKKKRAEAAATAKKA
jgi:large subunit ribosomal protein L24